MSFVVTEQVVDITGQLAVKVAKAFSKEVFVNNLVTNVEAVKAAKSQNTIETDVNTVGYKNVWQWE